MTPLFEKFLVVLALYWIVMVPWDWKAPDRFTLVGRLILGFSVTYFGYLVLVQ